MPKPTLKNHKNEILIVIEQLKMSREEVGEKCGVHVDAVNKWVSKGSIPKIHWETLQLLLKSPFARGIKGRAHPAFWGTDYPASTSQLSPQTNVELSRFSDKNLIDELRRRGWDVSGMLIQASKVGTEG